MVNAKTTGAQTVEEWENDIPVSSGVRTEAGPLDMSADDFGKDEQASDPTKDLWEEPPRTVNLPIPYKLKNGNVVRSVELRPMPHSAEVLMAEEGGNRAERAKRSMQFLSLLCHRIGSKERSKESKDSADFFEEELLAMPTINETCLIVYSRMLSVHLPSSGISGRKYVFEQYCPNKECENSAKEFSSSVRLDQLPMNVLPDHLALSSRKVSGAGNEIEWRHLTLADKTKILRVRDEIPKEMADGLLWLSITSLNGNSKPTLADVKGLPRAIKNLLFSQMEEAGLRVRLNSQCPKCKTSWAHLLPWEHRSFFSPLEGESDEERKKTSPCRF